MYPDVIMLELAGCRIQMHFVYRLVKKTVQEGLGHFPQIQFLELSPGQKTIFSGRGLSTLVTALTPSLQTLILNNSKLTDDDLLALQKATHLRQLDLYRCFSLTLNGIRQLQRFLTNLSVSNNLMISSWEGGSSTWLKAPLI